MKDAHVKVTVEERMRMEAILLDRDGEEALKILRVLRDRIEADGKQGLRSHLDS